MATWQEIPKPSEPFVYRTMAESIRDRGDIYMARGDAYFAEGKVSHAEGCWKKAQKKFERANALEAWMRPRKQRAA